MYRYVEDKEFLKKAQSFSSKLMHELEEELREEGINTQFFLVGSGARNMVTQNGDGPIDFDYNLNILSCDDINDCRTIKETTRKVLNKILRSYNLDDVSDSTIPLTTGKMHYNDQPEMEFYIDICIVTNDNGKWFRLKHEKTGFVNFDRYYWNESPNSKNYQRKSYAIKSVPGWWDEVRTEYIRLKNLYLRQNDHNHPSFICYIEAVNNIYNHMRQNGFL